MSSTEPELDKGKQNGASSLGSRDHNGTAITRRHVRSAHFAANPATKIPLERIEQYSRFRSTPVIHQTEHQVETETALELHVLPTSVLTSPKHTKATQSMPQLSTEQRMAGVTEPISPTRSSHSHSPVGRRLSRTGTRHSDRVGRRLSTTSSHASGHSWHGASGVLANLPTPGLLSSLAGAAHYTGNPKYSKQDALRASFGSRDVVLEDQRKQTLDDVLELYCAHPTLEIFERSWHRDAIFEDPRTKCMGYREYTAKWFALSKVFPQSTTLQHRVLSSTHHPHRIVFDQTQEYQLRFLKRKKIVQSLVTLELDNDGKIIRMEDRWKGEDIPRTWGTTWLRRLNGKTIPLFVHIPRRTPTSV